MASISNFPKYVAIYRPAENGYQVLFIADGKFHVLTSTVSNGVWFHVGKSKEYPQDDCFQVVRPSGSDGKEVYYWPTGFELVRNVPKTWPKGPVVRYPIFQFLKPPIGLSHTVIPAVASGEMNAEWLSAMKVIRAAAVLEHREFKDMPGLESNPPIAAPVAPVAPAAPSVTPVSPVTATLVADPADDVTEVIDVVEGTHWASLDVLLEAAKRIWWNGWREAGHFRKRVRVLDLDMLEPIEFLHFLRLAVCINNRVESSGGKKIPLSFTTAEVEKMKNVHAHPTVRDEILHIMSHYLV
jgi:hypothetical protein